MHNTVSIEPPVYVNSPDTTFTQDVIALGRKVGELRHHHPDATGGIAVTGEVEGVVREFSGHTAAGRAAEWAATEAAGTIPEEGPEDLAVSFIGSF